MICVKSRRNLRSFASSATRRGGGGLANVCADRARPSPEPCWSPALAGGAASRVPPEIAGFDRAGIFSFCLDNDPNMPIYLGLPPPREGRSAVTLQNVGEGGARGPASSAGAREALGCSSAPTTRSRLQWLDEAETKAGESPPAKGGRYAPCRRPEERVQGQKSPRWSAGGRGAPGFGAPPPHGGGWMRLPALHPLAP